MKKIIEVFSSNQLLCNQHYVDFIDSLGKVRFKDWDLDAYLCGKMGPGEFRPDLNLTAKDYTAIDGLVLNDSDGPHYGYELFLKPLETWPLRGAPFFWCEMARELTDDILPLLDSTIDEVVQKLKIEYGIPATGTDWIMVSKYCMEVQSGMSSGAVCADGVNQMAYEIKKRNSLYRESPEAFLKQYVKRFESFPYLFD